MGDPKKTHKHYDTPAKPWDKTRLDEERIIKAKYALKNKRELWKSETTLRRKRKNARNLLALPLEERLKREKELLGSLNKLGLLSREAALDDILSLKSDSLLERRLQTIVWRKGLAATPTQARQFIVHGHISVDGKKLDRPSYLVKKDEEGKIAYHKKELFFDDKKKVKTQAEKKMEFGDVAKKMEESLPKTKEGVEKKEATAKGTATKETKEGKTKVKVKDDIEEKLELDIEVKEENESDEETEEVK
ncbi:MAG: 30S ribosomal protein S4 [Candidatus Diapherotrites archaeon]